MSTYATFNGWNIVPMPSYPPPKDITFSANDSVGVNTSPFTRQTQTYPWIGADWWEAQVSMPPMTDSEARPWFAWFMSLRGRQNVFQLSDPLRNVPAGAATGNCTLGAPIIPGQSVISLSGLAPVSNAAVLLPGDTLQIAYRFHMVAGINNIASDGSGNAAAVEIWPSVRDAQAATGIVDLFYTSGLFRLKSNKREWGVTADTKLWTISFQAEEAR